MVDSEFLDYAGAELLLIGYIFAPSPLYSERSRTDCAVIRVSNDVEEDLGEMGAELKRLERLDAKKLSENKLFSELKMKRSEHPAEPLVQGTFK